MSDERTDDVAARAESLSAAFVESRVPKDRLDEMPLARRDDMVAQTIRFLTERGYTINAPTVPPSPRCVCGHKKLAHASNSPSGCLIKGGCDCAEFEAAGA